MKYLWKVESASAIDEFLIIDENDFDDLYDSKTDSFTLFEEKMCRGRVYIYSEGSPNFSLEEVNYRKVKVLKTIFPVRFINTSTMQETSPQKYPYHRLIWSSLLHGDNYSRNAEFVQRIVELFIEYGQPINEIVRALKRSLGKINGEFAQLLYNQNNTIQIGEGKKIVKSDVKLTDSFYQTALISQPLSVPSELMNSTFPETEHIEIKQSSNKVCWYIGESDERKQYVLSEFQETMRKKGFEETVLLYTVEENDFQERNLLSSLLGQLICRMRKRNKWFDDLFILSAKRHSIDLSQYCDLLEAVMKGSCSSFWEVFEELVVYSKERFSIVVGEIPESNNDLLEKLYTLSGISNIDKIIVSMQSDPGTDDSVLKRYYKIDNNQPTKSKQNPNKGKNPEPGATRSVGTRIKEIALSDDDVYETVLMAAFLKGLGLQITADQVFGGLNSFKKERLVEKSKGLLILSDDFHIILADADTSYSHLKKLIAGNESLDDSFSRFCVKTINDEIRYRRIPVTDLLVIRNYFLNNIDADVVDPEAVVLFEIYTILYLWDGQNSYLMNFETAEHPTSYWVDNTTELFRHLSSVYYTLDPNTQTRLRFDFIKARHRTAYALFYSGKKPEAIESLEKLRDENMDLYKSNYMLRFSIDDSLAWWNRETNPELSLKICEQFLFDAYSKKITLNDHAVCVMSHYACIMMFLIGERRKIDSFFRKASDYAEDLLIELNKTENHNEQSKDKAYGKVRLTLSQALSCQKRYKEAIYHCEKETELRKKLYDKSIYYYNAEIMLCRILTYDYRDNHNEDSYERAVTSLKRLLEEVRGIKKADVELALSELLEIRGIITKSAELLSSAKGCLDRAVCITREMGGPDHQSYKDAKRREEEFVNNHPEFND